VPLNERSRHFFLKGAKELDTLAFAVGLKTKYLLSLGFGDVEHKRSQGKGKSVCCHGTFQIRGNESTLKIASPMFHLLYLCYSDSNQI